MIKNKVRKRERATDKERTRPIKRERNNSRIYLNCICTIISYSVVVHEITIPTYEQRGCVECCDPSHGPHNDWTGSDLNATPTFWETDAKTDLLLHPRYRLHRRAFSQTERAESRNWGDVGEPTRARDRSALKTRNSRRDQS